MYEIISCLKCTIKIYRPLEFTHDKIYKSFTAIIPVEKNKIILVRDKLPVIFSPFINTAM